VADAIWGSTGVKSIHRLYGVHDLHLHVDEKLHVTIYELKLREILPHLTKENGTCPFAFG